MAEIRADRAAGCHIRFPGYDGRIAKVEDVIPSTLGADFVVLLLEGGGTVDIRADVEVVSGEWRCGRCLLPRGEEGSCGPRGEECSCGFAGSWFDWDGDR